MIYERCDDSEDNERFVDQWRTLGNIVITGLFFSDGRYFAFGSLVHIVSSAELSDSKKKREGTIYIYKN